MPLPPGGPPSGGGGMMRQMQGLMSPSGGGVTPDQLGAGGAPPEGGGPAVEQILALIETAPPEILTMLKDAIDAKLATSAGPPTDSVPSAGNTPGATPY